MIDAHAHLNEYAEGDLREVLRISEEHHVLTLSVAMDLRSFRDTEAIAARSPLVVPGLGIHPWVATEHEDALDTMVEDFARAPFVGEIGLDHRWITDESRYEAQERVFEHQLDVAVSQGKLVNIHCSGAEQTAADIMADHGVERAIVHWYAGSKAAMQTMAANGFLFTVGVEVLSSDRIRDVARLIPDDLLLTETDNPDGLRWLTGELAMPDVLTQVIDEVARLRKTTPDELADQVVANFARLVQDDVHFARWMPYLGGAPAP